MGRGEAVMRDEVAYLQAPTLTECEAVIQRGLTSFVEVGQALLAIRDGRLYRETHATFEDYCRERWGWSASHGRRLIDAAEVVRQIAPVGAIPESERLVRELAPLKEQPAVLRDVWGGIVERAERDETPITGPIIRRAVRDHIRGMAAEAQAAVEDAAKDWTPEQREAVSPERMRQTGEIMRLVSDMAALPTVESLPPSIIAQLRHSGDWVATAMYACGWLETLCDTLEKE